MHEEKNVLENIPLIYGRSKGLPWFDMIYKRDIILIGAGGIGSHVAAALSRTGAYLYIYDHDVFEEHNGGQVMFREDLGIRKTEAIRSTIAGYSPDCEVEIFGKYIFSSETGNIVICAPDKIEVRKMAFEKWAEYVRALEPEQRLHCFFQDGRLLAEQYRIFNIPGSDEQRMQRYYNEFLSGNRSPHTPKCTASQTEYAARMISGRMIAYLTNWLTNVKMGNSAREVPLSEEYFQANNRTIIIE